MEFDDLSNRVIGYAIEVHRELGPRLLESTYEKPNYRMASSVSSSDPFVLFVSFVVVMRSWNSLLASGLFAMLLWTCPVWWPVPRQRSWRTNGCTED